MTNPSTEPAESYLGRPFDAYQNMMQIARCIREAARQTNVARPRVLEVSRRDTGLQEYLADAEIVRHVTHADGETPDPKALLFPFADDEFQACLVTDVYEHIPSDWRPQLVKEMLRVTNGLVLIGSPHNNELVDRFDRVVFDFIWGKYGERFVPLEQHMQFGKDSLEQVLENVRVAGADCTVALPCNYVYRWIHQILIYFDLQHRHPDADLFEPLNRIYNEHIATYDYREPCYRYLVVISNHDDVSLDTLVERIRAPAERAESISNVDDVMARTFEAVDSKLSDRLRQRHQQMLTLQESNQFAAQEIERLNAIIKRLQDDNKWALDEIAMLRKALP